MDDYKGYDLTSITESVARRRYERDLAVLRSKGKTEVPDWHNLGAYQQSQIKSALLPVITDVIDTLAEIS